MAVADPGRSVPTEAWDHADKCTDDRCAKGEAPVAEHIADALKHTAERVPRTLLATNFGHRASRDPQGDHFWDGENAEDGGNNVNAVPEEQEIEGVALCPGLGIEGDKGHHQA